MENNNILHIITIIIIRTKIIIIIVYVDIYFNIEYLSAIAAATGESEMVCVCVLKTRVHFM